MDERLEQIAKSVTKISRRGFLALGAAFAELLRIEPEHGATRVQKSLPLKAGLSKGTLDLYDILKDEIRTNYKDNVYLSLGNSLHLDGHAYVQVSRALIAYDFLAIIRSSPMSEEIRQELTKDQISKTEAAFLAAATSLDWPKYSVELDDQEIRVSGDFHINLYVHKRQFLLFVLHNPAAIGQTVRFASDELRLPIGMVEIEAGSTRYVVGSVSPIQNSKEIKFNVATEKHAHDFSIGTNVLSTALLEGLLAAEEQDGEPPMARIRVVDAGGRYFAPEVEPSGVIRMPTHDQSTLAERWFYADGSFQVRVPLGKVKVSIRRGLEYRSLDEEIEIKEGGTVHRKFVLSRWAHMEKDGWYSGDMHAHNLDAKTALFESRAEGLNFVNVMVYKHLKYVASLEHFSGQVDPASDDRHFIYFNEEFRNEPMGHLELINLKELVQPISTGRLGLNWPAIETYEDLSMPLPSHGDANSPDFPLLLEFMRETHKQGGLVGLAHLRPSEWEFPLDAAEGQIDFVDIMTHTAIPQDLELWYALLNCDLRIPACAGTDRQEPVGPLGHQRVYVWLNGPLSYAKWIAGLQAGTSFVTNGPMLQFEVNAVKSGGVIALSQPAEINISARASSQIPFERLEIIVNGTVIRSEKADRQGLGAQLTLNYPITHSAWIAARCLGRRHDELYYSNPVFAHASPVYVRLRDEKIAEPASAKLLLVLLQKLAQWLQSDAYFDRNEQREEALTTLRKGMLFFERISDS